MTLLIVFVDLSPVSVEISRMSLKLQHFIQIQATFVCDAVGEFKFLMDLTSSLLGVDIFSTELKFSRIFHTGKIVISFNAKADDWHGLERSVSIRSNGLQL